ncbi:hypothetical protein [Roseimicrobium sp. ORNL1]|uniref:hypothetical protein n=1 Tax=Roseimicrobium sp. ORNL1 TaxID=2711231 RepID=UPI0013E17762|nr:hypothetical protein [Roseimicrobium sp. ORNL1]QIF02075.1 hypothetical protein G5S37_11205 [Roseimicrobium sp. ORNL1]
MTRLRLVLVLLAWFIHGAVANEPVPVTADQLNAEFAKNNLDYFKKYLSDCPETQIRCLWFLRDSIRIGMVMTMDLREDTVYTVRDVFDHARQNSQTREMSYAQTVTAEELLPSLPDTTPDVPFAEGLHISFWRDKKLHTVTYSKKATPLLIQRLYDVGGGTADFTYAK